MIHEEAIQQAIDRQFEIESKAAAWDLLAMHLQEQGNADGKKLLDWMTQLQTAMGAR